MPGELTVLALYGLVIMVTIFIETGLSIRQMGDVWMRSPRDDGQRKPGTAGRAERAVLNSTIAMALFAPAVLILHATDGFSGLTLAAAWTFLIARVVYVAVYIMGIPTVRTLVFVIGLLATMLLYILAL